MKWLSSQFKSQFGSKILNINLSPNPKSKCWIKNILFNPNPKSQSTIQIPIQNPHSSTSNSIPVPNLNLEYWLPNINPNPNPKSKSPIRIKILNLQFQFLIPLTNSNLPTQSAILNPRGIIPYFPILNHRSPIPSSKAKSL